MSISKESVVPTCCQWSIWEKFELRVTDSATLSSWPGEGYISSRGFIGDSLFEVQLEDKAETQVWNLQGLGWPSSGVVGGLVWGYCGILLCWEKRFSLSSDANPGSKGQQGSQQWEGIKADLEAVRMHIWSRMPENVCASLEGILERIGKGRAFVKRNADVTGVRTLFLTNRQT